MTTVAAKECAGLGLSVSLRSQETSHVSVDARPKGARELSSNVVTHVAQIYEYKQTSECDYLGGAVIGDSEYTNFTKGRECAVCVQRAWPRIQS